MYILYYVYINYSKARQRRIFLMPKPLTDKQQQILDYIETYHDKEGRLPSLRMMAQAFGVSLRAVQQHIIALKKKGVLKEETPRPASYSMGNVSDALIIPMLGSIAAGSPSVALGQSHQQLALSAQFFGAPAEIFSLKVSGNSMLGDQIRDGDWAVIERNARVRAQDIVAVRVDHDEFTLKRIERNGDQIGLIPSNSEFEPLWVSADRVEIVGKFVGLIRK